MTQPKDIKTLSETAQALVPPAKGILAADESSGTIQRRFQSIGVESTEESRRDYRETLFRVPASDYISGVILFDETLRQRASDGAPVVDLLTQQSIMPGIKVDAGAKPLAGAPGEMVTEGLDGLRERLAEYAQLGARFTKWRAVITIGPGVPTAYCIDANAHALARFAALSQEANLVPIVEPEVLMDGDHSIDRCLEVTLATLREVFYQLGRHRVATEGMLLKPNMVVSGASAAGRASPQEVAEKTLRCFMETVPASVPGIVFLSGGQGDVEASVNLDAINRLAAASGAPWQLSFSFGRSLQSAALRAWGGRPENVERAQRVFLQRAMETSAARRGVYAPALEQTTPA